MDEKQRTLKHVLFPSGKEVWYFSNTCVHRGNGPCEIEEDGTEIYRTNNALVQQKRPVIITPDGSELWRYVSKSSRVCRIKGTDNFEIDNHPPHLHEIRDDT